MARGLGCDAGSLADWVKKADAAGPAPDANPFQMAEDLRRLKRENERLKPRERDTFKNERLLRQQAAVGLSAKRTKFEFIFSNEPNWPVSGMCAALKAARQGCYAWKSCPPSAHDLRDDELAVAISRVRDEVRGIYGAPKTFMRLRARGVRTSRKRVARIMRERGWRGGRARVPSAPRARSGRPSANRHWTRWGAGSRPAAPTRRGPRTSPT